MTHTKQNWMKAVAAGNTELSLAEWEKQQAKHTPGPWRCEVVNGHLAEVDGANWKSLARVVVRVDGAPDHQGEANLRLILKAPEMLAKLKELSKLLDSSGEFGGGVIPDELADFIREIDPTY